MTDLTQRNDTPVEAVAGPSPRRDVGAAPRRSGTVAGRASLFVAGTGLALVAAHAVSIPTPPCPLRTTTGFPCPFCGLTHVARELLTGQVAAVARHDPAGLTLAVCVGVAVVAQLIALARGAEGPAFMTSRVVGAAVLAVLAVHWVTTIVTGGMLTA